LLLVAAGELADLALSTGVDLERRDRAVHQAVLFAGVDQAPAPDAGDERQADVLADGALHQQGLGAIGRDVDETRPDGVGRMVERDGRPIHEQLAPAWVPRAGQDVEELVLALALQGHDTEHFAWVEVERHVLQLRPSAEFAGREARRGRAAPVPVRPFRDRGHLADDLAEHELDDALLRARGDVHHTYRLALAQHRRPVADRGDLDRRWEMKMT